MYSKIPSIEINNLDPMLLFGSCKYTVVINRMYALKLELQLRVYPVYWTTVITVWFLNCKSVIEG